MFAFVEQLSVWAIPALLLFIPLYGFCRGIKVYETFVEGAAEGFTTAVRIIPFLVAMMVAIGIFRASGAMDMLSAFLRPGLDHVGIPPEIVPLAVMRPLSGSGALGITSELINTYGPDSFVGLVAATILGSTDTTFYILTVYYGAVGIKRARYSLFVGLLGDLVGLFASVYFCRKLFLA